VLTATQLQPVTLRHEVRNGAVLLFDRMYARRRTAGEECAYVCAAALLLDSPLSSHKAFAFQRPAFQYVPSSRGHRVLTGCMQQVCVLYCCSNLRSCTKRRRHLGILTFRDRLGKVGF
jgi:hypothetical protein